MSQRNRKYVWLFAILLLALSACGGPAGEAEPGGEPFVPGEADVGDVPLAAMVNGQPITQQDYERELARHLAGTAALGWETATDTALETQVLDLLIEYELIRQTAEQQGIIVSADQVEAEVNAAIQASGSQQDFEAWLAANQWTLDEFRAQVLLDLMTNELKTPVLAAVPDVAEQVHARHILVDSEAEAQSLLAQLLAGEDFTQLAADYSRDATSRFNGGDLGWFPRGALLVSEVEEVAFALELNALSDVVPSSQGYHIVQTLERDPARPIQPETMPRLWERALNEWRLSLWEGAEINRFIEPVS
jgi:parvulin-like peptidyl-prolyl isomerase